jgi:hypothetical protein
MLQTCAYTSVIEELPGQLVTHIIRPSRLLDLLYSRYPNEFTGLVGADPTKLGHFWKEMRKSPEFAAHVARTPFLRDLDADSWMYMVPLSIHEDAGPYAKRGSANVVSFSGLLARGGREKVPVADSILHQEGWHCGTS